MNFNELFFLGAAVYQSPLLRTVAGMGVAIFKRIPEAEKGGVQEKSHNCH